MLITAERRWACPNCTLEKITTRPGVVFHPCRGLRGLNAPMVVAGTRCKVEARERDDYIGASSPQFDGEGRPVMSIVTTRDDGQDATMLAPSAQVALPRPEFDALRLRLAAQRRNHGPRPGVPVAR